MRLPSSVKCLAAGLVVFFMGSALAAAQPSGDGASADAVSERQSMDAYTSLEDGQPSPPGALELRFDFGWSTGSEESDSYFWETELKYTGEGTDFLRNMKLSLVTPFELGEGGIDGNGDVEFAWQQRWVAEHDDMPTLATIFSVRTPTGYQSSGIDGTFTGILAKDCGPGTFFLNGWVTSANGNNIENRRDFQWGGRVAYLWRYDEETTLTMVYVHQTSEADGNSTTNLFELGAQFEISENLILGPGILVGLDNHDETPDFGAGIRITYSF